MPKNKIEDLRNHMFAAIEGLLDEEKPMDINRAKAVAQVGQVIINSAMAEVKALKAMGGKGSNGSGFFPYEPKALNGFKKDPVKN